jgi:hypothetical protein
MRPHITMFTIPAIWSICHTPQRSLLRPELAATPEGLHEVLLLHVPPPFACLLPHTSWPAAPVLARRLLLLTGCS